MKGKPSRKRQLHQIPPEFAEAERVQEYGWWQDEQARYLRKAQRDRERIMTAHTPPSPRIIGGAMSTEKLYESDKSYRKRLAKWYKRYGK